ncbi:hypothetical protein CKAN_02174600 [Cinnamomum micranthum f. kanehirae]|uniref:Apple domain-containing protein n=1 Tax=Cinnamomum micranthum f. kanehirae TaxID=337451 RepID=A0A443PP76_9MAGN|nr:hypothetical protein CKAN_02174600 [Cinnamomum micranthum f. kanehirae]
MARGEWGNQGRGWKLCSYKRTTIVICSINIVAALYVLHSLYTSLFIFSTHSNASSNYFAAIKYSKDHIRKMEESIRVRQEAEPVELIRLVKEIKKGFLSREESVSKLPRHVKQKMADEALQRLKGMENANVSEQRASLEIWRNEKLEETKQLIIRNSTTNLMLSTKEAKLLKRVLESDWNLLLEDIGIWIPAEVVNKEIDDKPENEEELEEEIIPGRPIPPECHAEAHTDYDGAAVRWGLTHHKESAADCCQACLDQAKRAKPGEMKCNIWVYCPSEDGCFSPDKYEHKHQECWLKQANNPRLNFKDKYTESYRNSHPDAPLIVPWMAGVVSA